MEVHLSQLFKVLPAPANHLISGVLTTTTTKIKLLPEPLPVIVIAAKALIQISMHANAKIRRETIDPLKKKSNG